MIFKKINVSLLYQGTANCGDWLKCVQLNRALGNSRSIAKIGFPLGLCDPKKFYLSNISSPLSSLHRLFCMSRLSWASVGTCFQL